jgi:hypothetical protein
LPLNGGAAIDCIQENPKFWAKKSSIATVQHMLLINFTSRKIIKPCLIKMKIYPSTLSRVVRSPASKQSLRSETSTLEIPLRSPVVAVGELNVQAKNKT